MNRIAGYVFFCGIVIFACTVLLGVTIVCLMGAGFIPRTSPPPILWLGLMTSIWPIAIGGIVYAVTD